MKVRQKCIYGLVFFVGLIFLAACSEPVSIDIQSPRSKVHTDRSIEIMKIDEDSKQFMIIGKISPPNALLSVAYDGDCGKSYYEDIDMIDGSFSISIASSVKGVDLFVYSPKGSVVSKYIIIDYKKQDNMFLGNDCDYLSVRRFNESKAVAYMDDQGCYEIGYKFGMCSSRERLGMECPPDTNVSIPFCCRDLPETKAGIEAGRI